MKINNKIFKDFFIWAFQIVLSAVVVIFTIFAPFTLLPSILNAESMVNRAENFEYQGILELWHVETFEGGSVSRGALLEKEAFIFEKQHKGTYIVIKSMNLEQFNLNINLGKKPNMISFAIGVGDSFVNDLIDLDAEDVRDDLLSYGRFGSKQVAVPYILGGYAIINSNTKKENRQENKVVGVGLKGATNPLKALQKNNMQITNLYNDLLLDSYDIYDKFVKGYFDCLIGTQRDVYRCYNRQQKGMMTDTTFSFLDGYTDLVQYVSVFKGNDIEQRLCTQFVSQLISNDTQSKLNDYNLFSTLKNLKLYQTDLYNDFENVLLKPLTSINVFINNEQIQDLKMQSFNAVYKKY